MYRLQLLSVLWTHPKFKSCTLEFTQTSLSNYQLYSRHCYFSFSLTPPSAMDLISLILFLSFPFSYLMLFLQFFYLDIIKKKFFLMSFLSLPFLKHRFWLLGQVPHFLSKSLFLLLLSSSGTAWRLGGRSHPRRSISNAVFISDLS